MNIPQRTKAVALTGEEIDGPSVSVIMPAETPTWIPSISYLLLTELYAACTDILYYLKEVGLSVCPFQNRRVL